MSSSNDDVNAERLAEAVGHELASDSASPIWADPRFLEWLTAETREAADRQAARGRLRGRSRDDTEFVQRGEAFLARVQARRFGVTRRGCLPPRLELAEDGSDRERFVPLVTLGIAAGTGRELWDDQPDGWIERPVEVPKGRYVALRVAGDSMTPLIHSGDSVLVRLGPVAKPDSIIVARAPDEGHVCKRVGRIGDAEIELLSLAPDRAPLRIPHRRELILGTVLMIWCDHDSESGAP